ncbi:hypothetical protein [Priestia abyssalis]|uniref:hypothetical protein n=1 Tax=Priestia abyssalis TaxID=1221450 RepID=UPI000994E471|nr:hypothetical protein [Priestia abyssalis]
MKRVVFNKAAFEYKLIFYKKVDSPVTGGFNLLIVMIINITPYIDYPLMLLDKGGSGGVGELYKEIVLLFFIKY